LYLKDKTKKTVVECGINVLYDRILDMLCVFSIAFLGVISLTERLPVTLSIILLILVMFTFFGLVFLSKQQGKLPTRMLIYLIPKSIKQRFEAQPYSLLQARYLYKPFLVGLLSWLIVFSQSYVVCLALGIRIPYIRYITLFPIASVVALVPITVAGLGTREATMISLLRLFGVAPSQAIALSLLSYTITTIIPATVGATFALKKQQGDKYKYND